MKRAKKTKRLLPWLLALLLAVTGMPLYGIKAQAEEPLTRGDYQYDLIIKNADASSYADKYSVKIVKYVGKGGEAAIPARSVKRYIVDDIGSSAFENRSDLTSIIIPSTIASIGNSAFKGCSGLTSIIIPQKVASIGNSAFEGCSSLTSIIILNSTTSIGDSAFKGCTSLTSLTIPASVTSIGSFAFGYTSSNEKIPNFTIYGESGSAAEAYASKNGFTFISTTPLANISDANIEPEKDKYFYDGTPITPAVTITLNGKILTQDTDYSVFPLYNINVIEEGSYFWKYDTPKAIAIGKGNYTGAVAASFTITKTGAEGGYEYKVIDQNSITITAGPNQKSIRIPAKIAGKNVAAISGDAFKEKDKLANLTIPDTVASIGSAAFFDCPRLKSIAIPASVTSIGDYAFGFYITEDDPDDGGGYEEKISDFVIYGKEGSAAEAYAAKYGFLFNQPAPAKQTITCKKKVYSVAYGKRPFKLNITSNGSLTYQSSNSKIASVGKTNGKVAIRNTGIAYITAKTKTDSVKITIKVSPQKPAVKSLTSDKRGKLTVKWKKDKRATGYQIQVSAAKNFKKITKKQNAAKNSCTFKNLRAGKKYYVRIRSYKKSGKSTLYSAWSSPRRSSKIKQ